MLRLTDLHWPKITRSLVLFTVGIFGIMNEAFLRETPRMELVLFYGGMVGLPAFLNHDDKRPEKERQKETVGR